MQISMADSGRLKGLVEGENARHLQIYAQNSWSSEFAIICSKRCFNQCVEGKHDATRTNHQIFFPAPWVSGRGILYIDAGKKNGNEETIGILQISRSCPTPLVSMAHAPT